MRACGRCALRETARGGAGLQRDRRSHPLDPDPEPIDVPPPSGPERPAPGVPGTPDPAPVTVPDPPSA